jgi:transposase InsO family protein
MRDGCWRRMIGWVVDEHMHADLDHADAGDGRGETRRGRPWGHPARHRGCQYTSAHLARFAREHNLVRSIRRTLVCWDNAQAESFWAILKVEFYDRYLCSICDDIGRDPATIVLSLEAVMALTPDDASLPNGPADRGKTFRCTGIRPARMRAYRHTARHCRSVERTARARISASDALHP